MSFYRTKRWPPVELGIFKLGCLLVGMILGAYLSTFVRHYLWAFIALAVLASARVCWFYVRNDGKT